MATKKKILTKEFVLLFIFSVIICSAMNMLNVLVPLYVTEDLGQTAAVSGFLSTVYTIASCVSRPVNGIIVERFGRRRLMFLGALLYGAACFAWLLRPRRATSASTSVSRGSIRQNASAWAWALTQATASLWTWRALRPL